VAYNLRSGLFRFAPSLELVLCVSKPHAFSFTMQNWNRFPRALLVLSLLIVLCAGLFAPRADVVEAKPLGAVDKVSVVISEFRTRGPNGADDEFVEIYNATGASVPIVNWTIKKSTGCGAVSATPLATINTTLEPGQYYLVGNSTNYSGASPLDTYTGTWSSISDDGGIALLDASSAIIDQVGLCNTTTYKEGTTLSPLSATTNQSYERKAGGSAGSCKDTDNNSSDFILNSSTSNPQNFSNLFLPCLVVTKVSSPENDPATYTDTSRHIIDIQVTFSNVVDVTGSPTLLIETGATDQIATYNSGTGTNTLLFKYSIMPGDTSADLNYASTNALSLNGGSIIGASGDAILVLPAPGLPGSLDINENIKIDISGSGSASLISFTRQNPNSQYTNADELIFRATFSEGVTGVDINDFVVTGTTGVPTSVTTVSSNVYDVKISGGNLTTAGFSGIVGLNLNIPTMNIKDAADINLASTEPITDETYTIDNTSPNVVSITQDDPNEPQSSAPVNFTIVFNEVINTSTFTAADITQSGSAIGVSWNLVSINSTTFTVSAITTGNGIINPSIGAGKVSDLAGNSNVSYLSTCVNGTPSNCVEFTGDTTSPTVTVNQSSTQTDPTSTLPINFTVLFSEPINSGLFTTSDITQNGTATGVTWSLANSGDNKNFTLSATAASGFGTIIPSIAANRVTDFSGNNNTASTSTDVSVTYQINTASARAVVINEVAWAGTTSSLNEDEWIELYNPGTTTINITGWTLKAADGTPNITLNGTISAKGYFLLERDNDSTVSDILAEQVYSSAMDLSNSGEALTLRDGANKIIDTANGNGGVWPKGSSSTYGTMERVGTSTESDSSWQTNTGIKRNGKNANNGDILGTPKTSNTPLATPTPTPAKTDTPTPISTFIPPDPRPIINEILPRPGFDWNKDGKVDVFDEFVEIKNLTSIDISLKDWKLDDELNLGSDPFTLPDITLKPGQRVVFFALETNILLSDGGDTVRLISPNGKIYDAYTYSIAKVEDQSICRLPDGNAYNGWFEDCIPTPNLTNTREGAAPTTPDVDYESPVCKLPDTLPADFLFAECHGYGADIWDADFWDQPEISAAHYFPQNTSKWEAIIE